MPHVLLYSHLQRAMSSTLYSLMQVLGKSAKPIPILIFGVLLGHRSYPILKYFIVVVIVIGVALFLYQDNGTTQQDNGKQWRLFHFVGIGELLVVRWRGVLNGEVEGWVGRELYNKNYCFSRG